MTCRLFNAHGCPASGLHAEAAWVRYAAVLTPQRLWSSQLRRDERPGPKFPYGWQSAKRPHGLAGRIRTAGDGRHAATGRARGREGLWLEVRRTQMADGTGQGRGHSSRTRSRAPSAGIRRHDPSLASRCLIELVPTGYTTARQLAGRVRSCRRRLAGGVTGRRDAVRLDALARSARATPR